MVFREPYLVDLVTKPMNHPGGEITELLQAWSGGDRSVEERLFSLVLPSVDGF
jgi:hypothetical protein